jgi:hypothetical protein
VKWYPVQSLTDNIYAQASINLAAMRFMTIAQALKSGLRLTNRNVRLLLLQMILNALALGLFYFFLKTGDASVADLILSLVLALSILFVFSLTQAGVFGAVAASSGGPSVAGFFRQGVRNGWRFLLAVLPIALFGYLLFLGHSYASKRSAALLVGKPGVVAFIILWCVILPVMLVTLWTSVTKHGLAYSFKHGVHLLFGRAFVLRALFVYSISFLIFFALACFLITLRTPIKSAWLEFSVLALRLGVSYVLIVYGWTVMAGAMASLMVEDRR